MKRLVLSLVAVAALSQAVPQLAPIAPAYAAVVTVLVTAVPTPGGIVSSKWRDGDDGTAAIPLAWATIGPFTNVIEGQTPCFDLRDYLTEPGTPDATLSLVGTVANWSLSTDDLCYDGSGVSSGTLIARATRDTATSDSLPFAVSSIAAEIGEDVTAPTVPTGVTAALNASDDQDVDISFDAGADVRIADEDVSGLSTFTVYRGVTALTPTAYTGTGLGGPTYTSADVGTLSPVGTSTQDDADWTLTAEGVTDTTHDEFRKTCTTVTGDFTSTVKIASMTGTSAARAGLMFRETTGTLTRYVSARVIPTTFQVRGHYRLVADAGTPVSSGLATYTAFPIWVQLVRAGDVWSVRSSADGNAWAEVLPLTLGLTQTGEVCIDAFSGVNASEITVEFENFATTTRPRQTYTDTGAVHGATNTYTVKAKDAEGNESAASASASIDVEADEEPPPPPESDTPPYVDPIAGVTVGAQTTVPVANNAALAAAIAGAACGDILSLANGNYTTSQTIAKVCAATAPLTIKCANARVCQFTTGAITLSGTNVIVRDIKFNGTGAKVNCRGTNNHVLANEFTGWNSQNAITIGDKNGATGTKCEIAYNEIHDPGSFASNTNDTQRLGIRSSDSNVANSHKGAWIHHNYFHDFPEKPDPTNYNSGQADYIEICQTQSAAQAGLVMGWYIEDNLFDDNLEGGGKGAAAIDFKCGGSKFLRNTITDTAGRLDARAGDQGNVFESNYIVRSGGMQLRGPNHKAVCNYLRAGGTVITGQSGAGLLSAMTGNELCTNVEGGTQAASCNALIESNDAITLTAGRTNPGADTFPSVNTTFRANLGAIVCGSQTGTNTCNAATQLALAPTYDCAPAFELTTGDVGPAAIAAATAAYKAARGL